MYAKHKAVWPTAGLLLFGAAFMGVTATLTVVALLTLDSRKKI